MAKKKYRDPRWGWWQAFLHDGTPVGLKVWAVSETQARYIIEKVEGFPFSPNLMTIQRVLPPLSRKRKRPKQREAQLELPLFQGA